jgi:hypothetical protein
MAGRRGWRGIFVTCRRSVLHARTRVMRKLVLGLLACNGFAGCSSQHTPSGAAGGGAAADGGVHAAPEDLPFASGGQRLHARYYVADGAEQFLTLHDNELGFDCDFAPDAVGDGMHCVPSHVFEVFYLDPDCKEPAVAVRSGDAAVSGPSTEDWISARLDEPASACVNAPPPAQRKPYRFGEQVFVGGLPAIHMSLPIPAAYALHGGKCESASVPQAELLPPAVYRVQPQDAKQLVAGTVSTLALEGALSVRRVVAEDATQITVGVLGRDGERCSLLPDGRCIPPPGSSIAESAEFFLDAECKSPAVTWSFPACEETSLGVRVVDDVVHVYEMISVHDLFTQNMGACGPFHDDSGVLAASKEITAMLPQASAQLTGTGRLHLNRFAAKSLAGANRGALVLLDAGEHFVDDAGYICNVEPAVDGSLRCLSDHAQVREADYFEDPACQHRLYRLFDIAPGASEPLVIEREGDMAPWKLAKLSTIKLHAAEAYNVVQTRCTPSAASPDPLFTKDRELPLDSLPAVEAVDL